MRVSYHKPDYVLIASVAIILIFGLVMLASASSVLSFEKFNDSNYLLRHQLIWGVLFGLVFFFIATRIDYHFWSRYSHIFLLGTLVLLVAVFLPGIGYGYGGSRRWINLGVTLLQPSEILKLTFIMYLSTLFSKNEAGIKNVTVGFTPFIIILGFIVALIMLQPDMGTMITIAVIGTAIYFIAGAPWKHLAWLLLGASGLFFLLVKIAPYRAARFTVFLNPALDPQGIGYHINQALLAIGSGGVFGLGLGHSRQKFLYLPEVTGDSIFAIIAEELGLIFAVALVALFVVLFIRGTRVARSSPDSFGKLMAIGITTWLTVQAFINIAAMVTLVPLTGIPLPFVSYGSSALIMALVAVGILVNISKQTKGV